MLRETKKVISKSSAKRLNVLMWAFAIASGSLHAAVKQTELPTEQAFVVNGQPFGTKAYAALSDAIRQHSPEATEANVLKGIVENHLLATQASTLAPSDGSDHEHHSFTDKVWQEYGMLLGQLFPVQVDAAQEHRCISLSPATPTELKAWLGTGNIDPGKLVDSHLSEEKIKSLSSHVVARVRCDEIAERQVTLDKIMDAADEASALQLWRGEPDTLGRLSVTLARIRLHEGLLLQQKRLSELDLATLWLVAADKQARMDVEAEAGVNFEMHHSPEAIRALTKTVTDPEIDAYYDKHAEDYQQIGSVKARHLTVAKQEQADHIVDEIRKGLPFDEAVRKYSIADDKNSFPPGDLGKIERTDKSLSFLKKLTLILPARQVSSSFRMPDGKTFEILWVDERVAEHLPKTDESVRSDIRREIAAQKARTNFAEALKTVWTGADISLNKTLFNAPWVSTWPVP